MCRSVPQTPVRRTLIRTSSLPTAGTGTSSSHNPASARTLTSAFIGSSLPADLCPRPARCRADRLDCTAVTRRTADGGYCDQGSPGDDRTIHATTAFIDLRSDTVTPLTDAMRADGHDVHADRAARIGQGWAFGGLRVHGACLRQTAAANQRCP